MNKVMPSAYPQSLHSIVLMLTAAKGGVLPTTHGGLLHAAFMSALREVNREPAEVLHESDERSPFTLSPLQDIGYGHNGRIDVSRGQQALLRVTVSDSHLLHDFTTYFMQGNTTLRLGSLDFQVSDIYSSPRHHKWARSTSPQELYTRWEGEPVTDAHSEIPLTFKSLTAFSLHNHRNYVLPDPVRVFSELARCWDTLSNSSTIDMVRAYAEECVVIAFHRITTRVYYYDVPQVGFTGRVKFKILDKENKALFRHLNRLADLAFYTGVGSKTGMGMGQVMREEWW